MYSVTPEEKPQARAQPELPNCLAVDSCMVICPPPPMHGLAPPVTTTKVDLKGKPALDTKPVFRQSEPSYSTSSSSLYSFLKTSSDALTNLSSDRVSQAIAPPAPLFTASLRPPPML